MVSIKCLQKISTYLRTVKSLGLGNANHFIRLALFSSFSTTVTNFLEVSYSLYSVLSHMTFSQHRTLLYRYTNLDGWGPLYKTGNPCDVCHWIWKGNFALCEFDGICIDMPDIVFLNVRIEMSRCENNNYIHAIKLYQIVKVGMN